MTFLKKHADAFLGAGIAIVLFLAVFIFQGFAKLRSRFLIRLLLFRESTRISREPMVPDTKVCYISQIRKKNQTSLKA